MTRADRAQALCGVRVKRLARLAARVAVEAAVPGLHGRPRMAGLLLAEVIGNRAVVPYHGVASLGIRATKRYGRASAMHLPYHYNQ